MSGFLNSIQYPTVPRERIERLRPRLWRSNDLRQHASIQSWGAHFEAPLSDGWGYPLSRNWRPPYENMPAWESYVRAIAEASRGKEIYWDIWNEPDTEGSWGGTREAFFETWIRAAKVLKRTLGPATKVGGPSTSSFQPEFVEGLLSRCRSADCEVNFLCWHELEPWSDIAKVEANVRHVRRHYVENPAFRELRLSEIHVNEFVGEVDQYRPAELLAFLYYLERGGADYASRSCWGRHCDDNSIDGIIDPVTLEPRAPWWVHAFYAAGCEHRVASASDLGHVVVIGQAVAAGPDQVHALVGYYGHEGATAARVSLQLRLSGLSRIARGRRVAVKVMLIPDLGQCTVERLPILSSSIQEIGDDRAVIGIDGLRMHEACAVGIGEV